MYGLTAYANTPYAGAQNQMETISVSPSSPVNISVGSPVSIVITVDDPDSFAVTLSLISGVLPAGLSINRTLPYSADTPYTATISGTPTTVGSSTLVYRVSDGEGEPGIADLTLVINVVEYSLPLIIGGNPLGVVYSGGRGRYGKF